MKIKKRVIIALVIFGILVVFSGSVLTYFSTQHILNQTLVETKVPLIQENLNLIEPLTRETTIHIITFLSLIIIMASLFILLRIDHFIAKPIESLAANLKELARGNLETRAKVIRPDEVGQLAIAFNGMISDLQTTTVSKKYVDTIIASIANMLIVIDLEGTIKNVNPATVTLLGYQESELIGKPLTRIFPEFEKIQLNIREDFMTNFESHYLSQAGKKIPVLFSSALMPAHEELSHDIVCIAQDMTEREKAERERQKMEMQLRHAQRLESIGQLAAGIAHEINTPTQYVSDNTEFLKDSFENLLLVLNKYKTVLEKVKLGCEVRTVIGDLEDTLEKADINFLLEEIPTALHQSLEGLGQVAKIVQAMKEFSHPGTKEKKSVDLNLAIQNTISVSKNEWKYVAEIETDFDAKMPAVLCLPSEINQVFLNLIVNAAHAIEEKVGKDSLEKGKITIATRHNSHFVEITVSDTGCGIPEEHHSKIFDPFFTTKAIGKGTGQGLAIAHSVVVDRHGGEILVKSKPGEGATFLIRLPIQPPAQKRASYQTVQEA